MNYYLIFLIAGIVAAVLGFGIISYMRTQPNNDGDVGLAMLALVLFWAGIVIIVLTLLVYVVAHLRVGWS